MSEPPQLPHDIYEALFWTRPTWHYVLLSLLVIAVLALIWSLFRAWRRRTVKVHPAKIDPWGALLARVTEALPPVEFSEGRPQEDYYYGLSLLLREAIETRTSVPATDLTMQELREPLRRALPLSPEEAAQVLAFLERADLVKFAGRASSRDEALSFHERAIHWVKSLTPSLIDQNPWEKDAAREPSRGSAS